MRDRHVLIVLCTAAIAAGCGSATTQSPPKTASASAGSRPAAIRRTHENLNATVWMQTAVEYRAAARQAYRAARAALDAALADAHETAAVEQTGDPSSLPAEFSTHSRRRRNFRPAHSSFSFTPGSFIVGRDFFAK